MPVLIKVSQNNNDQTAAFGKWYGRVVATKTMSYQELCKHMSEHNSVYGEDVCLGVANKLQYCILEQLLEGKKVQFGELGTFYLSVKSAGADNEGDFNMGININGLFLCFAPSRTDVNNLTSKMLKKKATFMNVKDLVVSKQKSTTGGSNGSGASPNPSQGGESGSGSGSGNSGSGSGTSENNGSNGSSGSSSSSSVTAPTISGTTPFDESTTVTISGPAGSTIKYTTNGVAPTATYGNDYEEPITLNASATVKAVAIVDGVASEVATKQFTKNGSSGGGGEEGM